uniref:C-type lectin domain-containing protein n=1 Tax=Poecilia latipinna TaxID=48699 RepID=A0A3B3VVK5_9TELE
MPTSTPVNLTCRLWEERTCTGRRKTPTQELDCSCRTEDASCCLQTTQISTEIYSSWFIEGFVFEDLTCLKCEAGWEQHGGNCYYFSTSKSSWTDSRRSCTDLGSDLVKIDSREEQDKFWIGLTDSKEEGKWLWMDGSLTENENPKFNLLEGKSAPAAWITAALRGLLSRIL